jgi:hypothetical protein
LRLRYRDQPGSAVWGTVAVCCENHGYTGRGKSSATDVKADGRCSYHMLRELHLNSLSPPSVVRTAADPISDKRVRG